jgi:hypothetical protein
MDYAILGEDSGLGILANTAGASGMHFAVAVAAPPFPPSRRRRSWVLRFFFTYVFSCLGRNNVKFSWNRRSRVLRLIAICGVASGTEILAAYGNGYARSISSAVRQQRDAADRVADLIAPVVMSHGAVQRMLCAKCRKVLNQNNRLTHARCCSGRLSKI